MLFLCAFWAIDERSDEGEGGHRHTLTPSPRAAITIKPPSTRAPSSFIIYSLKLQASAILRALWANDARSDEGEEGHRHHRHTLTPSPQAAITITTPITRAPQDQAYFLKSPMLAAGLQPCPPPPHTRQVPPAHVSMQLDIRLNI